MLLVLLLNGEQWCHKKIEKNISDKSNSQKIIYTRINK